MAAADAYGIVKGITATTFEPNATITRQQAMVMLHRAANVVDYAGKTEDISVFSDAN